MCLEKESTLLRQSNYYTIKMLYAFPIFNFPDNFPQVYNFLLHQSVTSTSCKIPTARIQAEANTKTATTTFCSSEKLFTRDQGMDGYLPLPFNQVFCSMCFKSVQKLSACLEVSKNSLKILLEYGSNKSVE